MRALFLLGSLAGVICAVLVLVGNFDTATKVMCAICGFVALRVLVVSIRG